MVRKIHQKLRVTSKDDIDSTHDGGIHHSLERLKDVQETDPFKTGTEEDMFVNAMMIALVVMGTRERHYKSENS